MPKSIRYLIVVVAVSVSFAAMAKPLRAQGLLERLEERVRQRLGGGEASPPNLPSSTQEAPPATQDTVGQPPTVVPATPPTTATGRVTLGLEAEERGFEAPYEIIVMAVRPGTTAATAGLKAGDLLISVDGQTVGSIEQLAGFVRTKTIGDSMKIGLVRQGENRELIVRFAASGDSSSSANSAPRNAVPQNAVSPQMTVPAEGQGTASQTPSSQETIAAAPTQSNSTPVVERPAPGSGRMGVTVENATTSPPGPGVPVKRGAVVVAVAPSSPASMAGIKQGDVIVSVEGVVIRDAAGLIEEVSKTRPGQNVEVGVYQGEMLAKLPIVLAAPAQSEQPQAQAQTQSSQQFPSQPGNLQPLPNQEVSGGLFGALGGFLGGNRAEKQAIPNQQIPTQPTDPPVLNQPPAMLPDKSPNSNVVPPLPTTQPLPSQEPIPSQDQVQQLQDEIELLRRQLDAMQRRLNQLEQQKPLEPTPLPTSG